MGAMRARWGEREAEQRDGAGVDCAVGRQHGVRCAGSYSCRACRSLPSAISGLLQKGCWQMRRQPSAPVQHLINSSASSSSVTVKSQGHLQRHASAHRGRRPCLFHVEVWGSSRFCTAVAPQEGWCASGARSNWFCQLSEELLVRDSLLAMCSRCYVIS